MDSSNDAMMQVEAIDETMMAPSHEESVPQLDPISESEDSSCGSASSAFLHRLSKDGKPLAKKRVSWSGIHTREYALIVGDHPLCQDGLPVSLDWGYNDVAKSTMQCPKISERKRSYVFPRRLSYEERRQRLCSVSGLTEAQVKNDEIDLVVRTLKESWEQIPMTANMCTTDMDPCPLPEDDDAMMLWDDVISQDLDVDLGDITDFEWTD